MFHTWQLLLEGWQPAMTAMMQTTGVFASAQLTGEAESIVV
jgi:hypothetical protein